jgi:hypothetical protein
MSNLLEFFIFLNINIGFSRRLFIVFLHFNYFVHINELQSPITTAARSLEIQNRSPDYGKYK